LTNKNNRQTQIYWTEIIQTIKKLDQIFVQLTAITNELTQKSFTESYELYRHKLRVQMSQTVVIAVLGGVKAGKSTVFQSLCQNMNIAITGVEHLTHRPLAYSQPVLDPPALKLVDLFPEFDIKTTTHPGSATKTDEPANRLWSMTHEKAPPGLVLVDCPDLNSMNQTNRELAVQLARACDIIFLVLLSGASAYSADIKNFTQQALQMGRMVVPIFTKMDDEAAARIVLDEFGRELTPLLGGRLPEFPYAFFVPSVPVKQRTELKKIRLRALHPGEFINLEQSSQRILVKARIWQRSYLQFRTQLKAELGTVQNSAQSWLAYWEKIARVLNNWGVQVARTIFPRNIVLREIIDWYEETKLNQFRKILRRINPVNWPSQLYRAWQKRLVSQKERTEINQQVESALEKLRHKLTAEANQTWVKIWGKAAPVAPTPIVQWIANHQADPIRFTKTCEKLVQQSLMAPYFSQQWQKEFRQDLEVWWRSEDEDHRLKRNFLEYSQITMDFISWLALPTTFFFPGTIDTIVIGVAQPVFTFINNHFIFIDSHFAGAQQRWIENEAHRLQKALIVNEAQLAQLAQKIQQWQQAHQVIRELSSIFNQIDEKLKHIIEQKERLP